MTKQKICINQFLINNMQVIYLFIETIPIQFTLSIAFLENILTTILWSPADFYSTEKSVTLSDTPF